MKAYRYRLLCACCFALLSIASCKNTDREYFDKCRYGKPEPIFVKGTPGIRRHNFQLRQREGFERVVFDNGKELTILQTGCDTIRQAFQFYLPGSFQDKTSSFWAASAVEEFRNMAQLNTGYMVFSTWAQAIATVADSIKLAESHQIQPGFFVSIDRVVGEDHAILMVTLSERP